MRMSLIAQTNPYFRQTNVYLIKRRIKLCAWKYTRFPTSFNLYLRLSAYGLLHCYLSYHNQLSHRHFRTQHDFHQLQ